MDELDLFWERHFGVEASAFERQLLAQITKTIAPGDPLFVVTAMLARQNFITLGAEEKALLQFGPALSQRMLEMETSVRSIEIQLATILAKVKQVERSLVMLDARVIDRERTFGSRMKKRAEKIVSAEYRATLPLVVGICLAFIAGVVAVSVLTPRQISQQQAHQAYSTERLYR